MLREVRGKRIHVYHDGYSVECVVWAKNMEPDILWINGVQCVRVGRAVAPGIDLELYASMQTVQLAQFA